MADFDLLCFGIAREIIGKRQVCRPHRTGLTAGALQRELLEEFPAFLSLASLRIAVNQSYVSPDHPISPGDEVALIPPVSGG